jgi:hypothetical protein
MKLITGFILGVFLAIAVGFAMVRCVAQEDNATPPHALTQQDIDELTMKWSKEPLPDLLAGKKGKP